MYVGINAEHYIYIGNSALMIVTHVLKAFQPKISSSARLSTSNICIILKLAINHRCIHNDKNGHLHVKYKYVRNSAPSVFCLLHECARGSIDEIWWIFQTGCPKVESLKTTPVAPHASQRSIYGVRY